MVDQATLEERLAYWQYRLGLLHWNIRLQICSYEELANKDQIVFGTIEPDEEHECALLKLLDADPDIDTVVDYDPERTLVHELLHILTAPLNLSVNYKKREGRAHERLINRLCNSFIDLDRGVGKEIMQEATKIHDQKEFARKRVQSKCPK